MDIKELVKDISRKTGLVFIQSFSGSNSYYCTERRIRISDHPSKYCERMAELFNDPTAVDLVNPELNFAIKLINRKEWFSLLHEGVTISHVRPDIVGDIEYISHNEEEGYVEVLKLSDNKRVKYNFEKIEIISQKTLY